MLVTLPSLAKVKHIIAVASGKGGVGKSTTAVNLALALKTKGLRVGLLDADIYGPSVALMLGTQAKHPESLDGKTIQPVEAYGLYSMSIAYLLERASTPTIWRGPIVSKALQQLLRDTQWGELDYLIVDMPPGTGDVQLTLTQKVPLTAGVIVTTPQDLALLDATKAVEMFQKVDVPVLGVIENMSTHICSQCGHNEPIFGEHGAQHMADDYHLPLLGHLPLAMSIRAQIDQGCPSVVADPESSITKAYLQIATALQEQVSCLPTKSKPTFPPVVVE